MPQPHLITLADLEVPAHLGLPATPAHPDFAAIEGRLNRLLLDAVALRKGRASREPAACYLSDLLDRLEWAVNFEALLRCGGHQPNYRMPEHVREAVQTRLQPRLP